MFILLVAFFMSSALLTGNILSAYNNGGLRFFGFADMPPCLTQTFFHSPFFTGSAALMDLARNEQIISPKTHSCRA